MRKTAKMEKRDIKSFTYGELLEQVKEMGEKPFRAEQLYQWMHQKLAADFDEMTNLSRAFREALKERYAYTSLEMAGQTCFKD